MKAVFLIIVLIFSNVIAAQNLSIKQVDTPPRLDEFCLTENSEDCFIRSLSIFVNSNLNLDDVIKENVTGTAYIQFTINQDASITGVRSRSKSKALAEAAEKAIQKLKIAEPAKKDGEPVTINYTLPVSFRKIEINGRNATVEDNSAVHEIPILTAAARAPEIKGYAPEVEAITRTFKNDLREKLLKLNFKEKDISELKISFILNKLKTIEKLVVITPNKRMRNTTRNFMENLQILKPALDKNGQPMDVRIYYNFQFN